MNSHFTSDAVSDERLADGEDLVARPLDPLARELGLLRQVDDGGHGLTIVSPLLFPTTSSDAISPVGNVEWAIGTREGDERPIDLEVRRRAQARLARDELGLARFRNEPVRWLRLSSFGQ